MKQLVKRQIFEALGSSEAVREYSDLVLSLVLHESSKHGREKSFSKLITLSSAYLEVSEKSAKILPIDHLIVKFTQSVLEPGESRSASGAYYRGYEKDGRHKSRNINLKIDVELVISDQKSYDEQIEELKEIINHEFTHALNDYAKPLGQERDSRFAYMTGFIDQVPPINECPTIKVFFNLLYALSKIEQMAIAGGVNTFANEEEFWNYSGTRIADIGKTFDHEEWATSASIEFARAVTPEGLRYYWQAVSMANDLFKKSPFGGFGGLFISIYERYGTRQKSESPEDRRIMSTIRRDDSVKDVFRKFEPSIRRRGKELFRKLAKKIGN